jgi:DhnA family fructose-bisphosphate aldolase class Ia
LDFAKTLLRINYDDAGSLETLESNAHAVDEAVSYEIPIMLEPFISRWVDGKAINDLSTEAVIRSVAIAAGLGSSSAYSWLKLPVVDNMEAVMSATTLPTLLLGGDPDEAPDEVYETWSRALTIPGVFGLTVGRTLLYPRNGDVAQAVDIAASLVHG